MEFFKVGDKVEAIDDKHGAWIEGVVLNIIRKPKSRRQFFFSILFETKRSGKEKDPVTRSLAEIRQISYESWDWRAIAPGTRLVVNYNVKFPGSWGLWYDYDVTKVHIKKRVTYLTGNVLVGLDGWRKKIPYVISSDTVMYALKIREHTPVAEKESDDYPHGARPEYCRRCKNNSGTSCTKCCCCICGSKTGMDTTLQCDECDKWFHAHCVNEPVPDEDSDWYCHKCRNPRIGSPVPNKKSKIEAVAPKKVRGRPKKITAEPAQKKKEEDCERKRKRNAKQPADTKEIRKVMPQLKATLKVLKRKAEEPDEAQEEAKWNGAQDDLPLMSEVQDLCKPTSSKATQEDDDVLKTVLLKRDATHTELWREVDKVFSYCEVVQVAVSTKSRYKPDDFLTTDAEIFIANDVANAKLWNEALACMNKGKKVFLDCVRSLFTCPICQCLLTDPITLYCKHNFCMSCFFNSIEGRYNCAICRTPVVNTPSFDGNDSLKKVLMILLKDDYNE